TAMHLSSDSRSSMWWLMVTPEESMSRLLLVLMDAKRWSGDVPGLMRGTLALQHRGAWSSTIANAWGTLAIEKFAAAFEAQRVAGETTATLGTTAQTLDWS